MRDRQFQKSQEAETLIFNKKVEKYNDDKIIESQLVNKGFEYKATAEELGLIVKIKEFCEDGMGMSEEWKKLSGLRVEGSTIYVDSSALQIG